MGQQARWRVRILPGIEDRVLADDVVDVGTWKLPADRAAVFVPDPALRLIEDAPAAFPGHQAEVAVLHVKGPQQRVESAQLEEFAAVKCARTAASIEAGPQCVDRFVGMMPRAQPAALPPGLRLPCLFALLCGIDQGYLVEHGEHIGRLEAVEQRLEEVSGHPHVAVEQDYDVVARGLESA